MLSRRDFIQVAAAMGASLAWGGPGAEPREPRGASGATCFPRASLRAIRIRSSVILWTRRPFERGERQLLTVEVAEDEAFRRVVAQAPAPGFRGRRLDGPSAGRRA